ncbi:MAG: T4 RnlA family RNA ligase [Aggregatilineales bacterium]
MNYQKRPLEDITSIEDIQTLAKMGFSNWLEYGDVNVAERGDLRLFDYTTGAHIANRWNFFERVSRGLMLNAVTGEIVARPFDKFFYWMANGMRASGYIVTVTEKVDGSLGILYRHKEQYHITTKGSFFSPQARWATKFLNDNFDLTGLADEWTLLFEIIYPDNRIIVNYDDREDLVLLAARNRFTGEFMPFFPDLYNLATEHGFTLPQVYQYNRIEDIIAETGRIDANFEGWVVEFSDGSRFKFKMDEYIEIHKLMRGSMNFEGVLKAYIAGDIEHMQAVLPPGLQGNIGQWVSEIEQTIEQIEIQTQLAFSSAPPLNQAAFIEWANVNHPILLPYLQAYYDGRKLRPIIFRHAFREKIAE